MQSSGPSEPDLSFLNEQHRSVLNIITACSPCTEPKLFISAINAKLDCFSDTSLSELRDRLDQCVKELKASGVIKIVDGAFVIAAVANEDAISSEHKPSEDDQHSADDASWSQMQRTYADLEGEAEAQSEASEGNDVGTTNDDDPEVLDLTDDLELLDLEDAFADETDIADAGEAGERPDQRANGEEASGMERQVASQPEPGLEPMLLGEIAGDGTIDERGEKERAEDEGVFDLTDALELTEVEDATFDQDPAEAHVADSSQQPDEPTREEIVDAIREFMSLDTQKD